MIRDTEASTYFPEPIRDECLKAYHSGMRTSKERRSGLTEEEVRVDEARKARWTFERQRSPNTQNHVQS